LGAPPPAAPITDEGRDTPVGIEGRGDRTGERSTERGADLLADLVE
jgi:hypothetical protein